MNLIVADGIDNTGKTWIANTLCELDHTLKQCHFPSDELAKSDLFKKLVDDPTREVREEWIRTLLAEEYDTLSKFGDEDTVIVDRMWISTLIYQGSGSDANFFLERDINRKYEDLMEKLKVHFLDIVHILLVTPLTKSDATESNEAKKKFDAKQDKLLNKMFDLIAGIVSGSVRADHLNTRIVTFNEPQLAQCFNLGVEPGLDLIKKIQNQRVNTIHGIIESMR